MNENNLPFYNLFLTHQKVNPDEVHCPSPCLNCQNLTRDEDSSCLKYPKYIYNFWRKYKCKYQRKITNNCMDCGGELTPVSTHLDNIIRCNSCFQKRKIKLLTMLFSEIFLWKSEHTRTILSDYDFWTNVAHSFISNGFLESGTYHMLSDVFSKWELRELEINRLTKKVTKRIKKTNPQILRAAPFQIAPKMDQLPFNGQVYYLKRKIYLTWVGHFNYDYKFYASRKGHDEV